MASFWNSSNIFFFPSYTASFCLSQNPSSETLISHFSITLLKPSKSLVSASLKSSHSQVSISPSRRRTVAAHPLSLAPSHFALRISASSSLSCRTSQLSLSPASPSQRSLDRSSLVAVAAQPRHYQYQRFRVAVNFFSFFFWNFFFLGSYPVSYFC